MKKSIIEVDKELATIKDTLKGIDTNKCILGDIVKTSGLYTYEELKMKNDVECIVVGLYVTYDGQFMGYEEL